MLPAYTYELLSIDHLWMECLFSNEVRNLSKLQWHLRPCRYSSCICGHTSYNGQSIVTSTSSGGINNLQCIPAIPYRRSH